MVYNQPYLVVPIRNFYYTPIFPPDNLYSSIQHIWPNWTSFKIMYTITITKVTLIHNSFIIHYLLVLIDSHFSATNSSYIKLDWILVSHHPDDIITISLSAPPDLDLDDNFSQPPAEEILLLIETIKNTDTRSKRSLTANLMTNNARRL